MILTGKHDGVLAVRAASPDSRGIRAGVIALAWPVFAELVLQTLTQIVDMVMVGRLGPGPVAAVGLSVQPLMVLQSVFMGLSIGATAVVARRVGEEDARGASEAAWQALIISLGLATLLNLPVWWLGRAITALMGARADVVRIGGSYLAWLVPGNIAMMGTMAVAAALRGAGDTSSPMKVNALVNVINVAANYVLIFGKLGFPALGVDGAAIATSLSRTIGSVILVGLLFSPAGRLTAPTGRLLRLNGAVIWPVVRVGAPAVGERAVLSLALVVYTRVVAQLGTAAAAAHSIALNAESLSFMPGMAFQTAATTLVGQNLGAGLPDAATRSATESARMAMLVMGLMGMVFLTTPVPLMRIYTSDPEIVRMGSVCLRVIAFAQVPMAVGFVLAGALRAAGDTRSVLYITSLSVWGIRVGLSLWVVGYLGWGLFGAWLVMALDWVARSLLTALKFASGEWRSLRV